VTQAEKIAAAFAAMTKQKTDGLTVFQDPMIFSQAKQVLALVLKNRLPAGLRGERVGAGGWIDELRSKCY
jgi:hypothetical protein